MHPLRFAVVGLAILSVLSVRADSWPWPLPGAETRHKTGIALLGPIDFGAIRSVDPLSEPLGRAWQGAFTLAQEGNPDVLGYPWPDRTMGELVVPVANAAGEALARRWVAAGAGLTLPKGGDPVSLDLPRPEVRVRILPGQHSIRELQKVMDDVIDMNRARIAGAERIYSAGPDPEHNRIIIETDRVDDQLLEAIAMRFGVEVIAVRVNPNGNPFNATY